MRSALFVAVALFAACKGEPFRPDAADGVIDAAKPAWFSPEPGAVKNWDIQIRAPYSFTQQRAMMIVDLWDVVPAETTLTYADSSTVMVPAGSQATAIATLKAAGTTVICHVGTGAMRLDDPDAMKFPGYEANPPNRPVTVAAGSAIGWSTSVDDANERFVDYRNAAAATVLLGRLKLAKDIGCDGILAYRNDLAAFGSTSTFQHGFSDIASEVETAWIEKVAKAGHDLKLSVGGRGGHSFPNLGELVDDYDWLVAERCAEIQDCSAARPVIAAHKAVFGIDYDLKDDGTTPNTLGTLCTEWTNAQIDGVLKSAALDSSVRMVCP